MKPILLKRSHLLHYWKKINKNCLIMEGIDIVSAVLKKTIKP